jgi:hypothetical protein
MKRSIIKIESFFLACTLLISCLLVSCGADKPRIVKWENMDVTIQNYEPITPELVKNSPPDPKELEQNSKAYQAYYLPEKGYYYQIDEGKLSKNDQNNNTTYTVSDDDYLYYQDYYHQDQSNPYLNPKTLIHPEPRQNEDVFPMDLFVTQKKDTITVNLENNIYSAQKNKKVIIKSKILAYSNPWILTTDGVKDRKIKLWNYSLYNTDTDQNDVISIPGKIDSVTLVNQGLFITVIEQAFFKTTSWIYNPSSKKLLQIGEAHTKIISVKDTPWIVFWDWYENNGKVFNYDQWKEVYRIDFGKYQVRSIIPYVDTEGMWNLWMIPTLTYEKFISNVFWMPLTNKEMVITNMDFHISVFVNDATTDSQGRLLLYVREKDDCIKPKNIDYYFFLAAKKPNAWFIPVQFKDKLSLGKFYPIKTKKDSANNDFFFSFRENLSMDYEIKSKIQPLSMEKVKESIQHSYLKYILEKNPKYDIINVLYRSIIDGKVSVNDHSITWKDSVEYTSFSEYKIPFSKLVPKK